MLDGTLNVLVGLPLLYVESLLVASRSEDNVRARLQLDARVRHHLFDFLVNQFKVLGRVLDPRSARYLYFLLAYLYVFDLRTLVFVKLLGLHHGTGAKEDNLIVCRLRH